MTKFFKQPPAIRFVLGTILINAIALGIVIPVTPAIVMALGAGGVAEATAIGGWLSFAYAASQFLFSPLMGNLSDRFGRRPVLLISMGGMAIDFLILALAPTLAWVFAIRIVAGVFGASTAPAQSVIADVVPVEERARAYGMIGAAFGAGFVIGPALGGLLGALDTRMPFFIAAGLTALVTIYGWYAMPETLAPEHRRRFEWWRANPLGALLQVRKLGGIGAIATVYLLWQVSSLVYPMTWSYFAIARYGWSETLVGVSLAAVGLMMIVVQSLLLPGAVRRYGERGAAMRGILVASLTMLGFAAATQGWMALVLLPLIAAQSLVHPNLTAMLTRRADATTQGEVQGFASSVMAVGALIAPLLYNPLQAHFTSPGAPYLPGIAYFVAGATGLACVAVLVRMKRAAQAEAAI